jgi:hypothetical protein
MATHRVLLAWPGHREMLSALIDIDILRYFQSEAAATFVIQAVAKVTKIRELVPNLSMIIVEIGCLCIQIKIHFSSTTEPSPSLVLRPHLPNTHGTQSMADFNNPTQ